MPRSIETENITVAMPVDLLDLLDDLCIRKDLHRTQTVVRAIKAYLALDAVSDCSLLTMAAGAWQDGPAPKDGSWILGLFYGLPYVVCYDSWEISEEGGPKETEEGWCLAGQDMHPMDQDEPEKWARIIHPNRHMPASWDGPGD
jgi:hypothetical protein